MTFLRKVNKPRKSNRYVEFKEKILAVGYDEEFEGVEMINFDDDIYNFNFSDYDVIIFNAAGYYRIFDASKRFDRRKVYFKHFLTDSLIRDLVKSSSKVVFFLDDENNERSIQTLLPLSFSNSDSKDLKDRDDLVTIKKVKGSTINVEEYMTIGDQEPPYDVFRENKELFIPWSFTFKFPRLQYLEKTFIELSNLSFTVRPLLESKTSDPVGFMLLNFRRNGYKNFTSSAQFYYLPSIENNPRREISFVLFNLLTVKEKRTHLTKTPEWIENYSLDVEEEIKSNLDDLNEEREELDLKIDSELGTLKKINSLKKILYTNGKELEKAIFRTFELLDIEIIELPTPENHDGVIKIDSEYFFIEMKGFRNRSLNYEDFTKHLEKYTAYVKNSLEKSSTITPIIIVNHFFSREPDERRGDPFDFNLRGRAEEHNFKLITTPDLFEIIRDHYPNNSEIKSKLKSLFKDGGNRHD